MTTPNTAKCRHFRARARRAAAGLTAALGLLAGSPARAFDIQLTIVGSMTAQEQAAFEAAAQMWESRLADPITVKLRVGWQNLPANVLGSTTTARAKVSWSVARASMFIDAVPGVERNSVNLLPGGNGSIPIVDTNGTRNVTQLTLATANAKALGISVLLDPNYPSLPAGIDGQVYFANAFKSSFDLDRSNGIGATTYDFVGVAAHEIGHALGFLSMTDVQDANPSYELLPSTLDLWRFDETGSPHALGVETRVVLASPADHDHNGGLRPVSHGIESIDPLCNTASKRCQASHWSDDQGLLMDPTVAKGVLVNPNNADTTALDYIGYDRKLRLRYGVPWWKLTFEQIDWPIVAKPWPPLPDPPPIFPEMIPRELGLDPTHSMQLGLDLAGYGRRSFLGVVQYDRAQPAPGDMIETRSPQGLDPGFEELDVDGMPLRMFPPQLTGLYLISDERGMPLVLRSSGPSSFDPTIGPFGGFRVAAFVDGAGDGAADDDASLVVVIPLPSADALEQLGSGEPIGAEAPAGGADSESGMVSIDPGALGQQDGDRDEIPDVSDNCPYYATDVTTDTDGDGRGDECECTDLNGDGLNTVSDMIAINRAIFDPNQDLSLCDGNNDGQCNVSDILSANAEIFSQASTSTCSRYPVPGP
jgi:hypothetical protein